MTARRGGGATGASHEYVSKAVISESREQVAWGVDPEEALGETLECLHRFKRGVLARDVRSVPYAPGEYALDRYLL